MTLHTGKTPATPSPSDFKVREILDVERAAAAPFHWHDTGFALQMYGNGPDPTVAPDFDGAGDCVLAMISNAIQFFRHAAGLAPAPLNGKTAIAAYSEITGYRIGDANTDRGTDMGVAASWWRKTGMQDLSGARHTILASATFDPTNLTELEAVIKTFGVAGVGINFPSYAMTEFDAHKAWSWHAGGVNDGGHAILVPRPERVYTWAEEIEATRTFLERQADEAFAFISREFLNAKGTTPEGLDLAMLDAKLAAL